MDKEWAVRRTFEYHIYPKFPSKKYDENFVRFSSFPYGLGERCIWQYHHDGVEIFFDRHESKGFITGEISTFVMKYKIVVDGAVIKEE